MSLLVDSEVVFTGCLIPRPRALSHFVVLCIYSHLFIFQSKSIYVTDLNSAWIPTAHCHCVYWFASMQICFFFSDARYIFLQMEVHFACFICIFSSFHSSTSKNDAPVVFFKHAGRKWLLLKVSKEIFSENFTFLRSYSCMHGCHHLCSFIFHVLNH